MLLYSFPASPPHLAASAATHTPAERRSSKIVSIITSCFTANYVRLWQTFMRYQALQSTPMFDGRAVCYPSEQSVKDYLAWRQADTHVNNQYNTCFWSLVKAGNDPAQAQAILKVRDCHADWTCGVGEADGGKG